MILANLTFAWCWFLLCLVSGTGLFTCVLMGHAINGGGSL